VWQPCELLYTCYLLYVQTDTQSTLSATHAALAHIYASLKNAVQNAGLKTRGNRVRQNRLNTIESGRGCRRNSLFLARSITNTRYVRDDESREGRNVVASTPQSGGYTRIIRLISDHCRMPIYYLCIQRSASSEGVRR